MAFVIATATAKIGADLTGLKAGLLQAKGMLGKFVAGTGGFTAISAIPTTILAGAGISALASAALLFYKAAQGAGNLGESINKLGVAFGAESPKVLAFAQEMADRFGLVNKATLESAAGFGLMLRAAGLGRKEASKMSIELVKLAADISSVHNIPIDIAMDKLRSGLAGQVKPLRIIGGMLSADAVKANAYAMGIAKAGSELTEQQKVLSRYSLMRKQLKFNEGDLERTAESPQNIQRTVGGRFQNVLADAGKQVLPIWQEALRQVNDLLKGTAKWFEVNKQAIYTWTGRGVEGVRMLSGWLARMGSQVIPAIGDAMEGLVEVWENWDLITQYAGDNIDTIFQYFLQGAAWLKDNATNIIALMVRSWVHLAVAGVKTIFDNFKTLKNFDWTKGPILFMDEIAENYARNFGKAGDDIKKEAVNLFKKPLVLEDRNADHKQMLADQMNERTNKRKEKEGIEFNLSEIARIAAGDMFGKEGKFPGEEMAAASGGKKQDLFSDPIKFAKDIQEAVFGEDKLLAAAEDTAKGVAILVMQGKGPVNPQVGLMV